MALSPGTRLGAFEIARIVCRTLGPRDRSQLCYLWVDNREYKTPLPSWVP